MSVHLADEQGTGLEGTDFSSDLASLARLVLAEEGYPESARVSVTLVTEEAMAEHNRRFLGRSGPTDVLSFPIEPLEPGRVPAVRPGGPPLELGDVLIAPDYVRRQALRHGVGFETEMALMVVHGMLHLLGYDHASDEEAEVMEGREREILALVGMGRR